MRAKRSSKLRLVGMSVNTRTSVSRRGDILAVGGVGKIRITILWKRRGPRGRFGEMGL